MKSGIMKQNTFLQVDVISTGTVGKVKPGEQTSINEISKAAHSGCDSPAETTFIQQQQKMNNGDNIFILHISGNMKGLNISTNKFVSSVTKTTWNYVSLLMSGKCNLYGRCVMFSKCVLQVSCLKS